MRVRDVMRHAPRLCTPEDSLATAGRIMTEANCGILPVVAAANGRVVGVLTDRDICVALTRQDRLASKVKVGQVMSKSVHTCHFDDGLHGALVKMGQHRVRRLAVVGDRGQLKGVLTLDDVVRAARAAPATGFTGPLYDEVGLTLKAICEPPLAPPRPPLRFPRPASPPLEGRRRNPAAANLGL